MVIDFNDRETIHRDPPSAFVMRRGHHEEVSHNLETYMRRIIEGDGEHHFKKHDEVYELRTDIAHADWMLGMRLAHIRLTKNGKEVQKTWGGEEGRARREAGVCDDPDCCPDEDELDESGEDESGDHEGDE